MVKEEIIELLISGESPSTTKSRGMTARGLAVSLGVSIALALGQIMIFSVLRKKYRAVYEPRTFIVPRDMRAPSTEPGLFSWIPSTLAAPLEAVQASVGLDAYFFLRYLLFVISLCGALGLLMVPVLLPLHVTGSATGSGLERLSISNISWENRQRHLAHLTLCTICAITALWAFRHELETFYRIRAEYLTKNLAPHSSSTLLIKGVYPEYQTPEAIAKHFSGVAGSIRRIWFNRDYTGLHKLVRDQRIVLDKLETNECWLIQKCNQPYLVYRENKDASIVGNLWRHYLKESDLDGMHNRQGARLTSLKSQLSSINSQVYLLQSQRDLFPQVNSCFVQFDSSIACFMATRSLGVRGPRTSPGAQTFGRVYATDVMWANLSSPTWLETSIRIAADVIDFVVILGWAFPVAVVGMITQVEYMAQIAPSLEWMVQMPRLSRLMSSVVSPLALSYLTSQVPYIFRALAGLKGYPTRTLVEMDVQKYMFLFMFFQLFLIVTLATGLPSLLLRMLLNTSEGAISLASSLPKATNFFLSYLIASSFTTSGNSLMQSAHLFWRVWDHWFAKTPRQRLRAMCRAPALNWGSLYPVVTNVGAIAMAYALVSPLILFGAVIGSSALFLAFKYRILYCYIPRCIADGQYYPAALFQLFSGLYCQELSLLGTLLLAQQHFYALLCATLIVSTMVGHYRLNSRYHDMSSRIPLNTAGEEGLRAPDPEMVGLPSMTSATSNDYWMALFDNIDTDFSGLSREQQDWVASQLFEHPDVRSPRPCVWLPRDERGIAADQVKELQLYFSDLRASCAGTELGPSGRILVRQAPPDFDTRDHMRL